MRIHLGYCAPGGRKLETCEGLQAAFRPMGAPGKANPAAFHLSAEDLDNARHQAEQALANHQQAMASRDIAALNLSRTEVRSTVNGYVTKLNLKNGDYAAQGKSVLAVIDSDSYRVDAYFEETKIPQIKTGSEAEIRLMDGSPAPGVLISAGMTCTAIVKQDQQLRIRAGVKRLLSALL